MKYTSQKSLLWLIAFAAAIIVLVLVLPENQAEQDAPVLSEVFQAPESLQPAWVQFEHVHTWQEATATSPKTCSTCGATVGSPLRNSSPFANVRVGDTVYFGSYEQDNNLRNGKEPIAWQVIDVCYGEAVLMSKYALDYMPFHDQKGPITWADSDIRYWLNDDFLYEAFTYSEQDYILINDCYADLNPDHPTVDPGEDTFDYVWLFSVEEALDYFPDYRDRKCEATAYAKAQGLRTCWWWMRTPGKNQYNATSINSNGSWDEHGSNVRTSKGGVRPLIRVDMGEN